MEAVSAIEAVFATEPARRLAKSLFDQQMWCFGCDVRLAKPHALLEWGFERHEPPSGSTAPSHYRWEGDVGRVGLWGFGVWFAQPSWGSLLLKRGPFVPRFSAGSQLSTNVWAATELTGFRHPKTADERQTLGRLLSSLANWMADYERWVRARYGMAYRNRAVDDWSEKRSDCVPTERMTELWDALCAGDANRFVL
ncbi:hypothetical protein [Thalassoroseus pseudoceratinae]|uniref:hypothetical protein n=1 Tax=Thalassoroseus pseudoceratinae TaxID=2713176 RepID=UPI00141FE1F7|nr:hypothetical protein [Thalassoroseus pseudoceratinae]